MLLFIVYQVQTLIFSVEKKTHCFHWAYLINFKNSVSAYASFPALRIDMIVTLLAVSLLWLTVSAALRIKRP